MWQDYTRTVKFGRNGVEFVSYSPEFGNFKEEQRNVPNFITHVQCHSVVTVTFLLRCHTVASWESWKLTTSSAVKSIKPGRIMKSLKTKQ